jgi:hypothetical protein
MVHPTKQAAAYLCDRFIEWVLPVREWDLYESNMDAWRRSRHRPLYSSE